MENKEIEDEEMLVNETSEECDLDLEDKARETEYQKGYKSCQEKDRENLKSGYVIGFNEAKEVLADEISCQIWENAYMRGYEEGQEDAADAVADDYYALLKSRHDAVVKKDRRKHCNAKLD